MTAVHAQTQQRKHLTSPSLVTRRQRCHEQNAQKISNSRTTSCTKSCTNSVVQTSTNISCDDEDHDANKEQNKQRVIEGTNEIEIGLKRNLAIIGGRGSGKSSVSRRLFAHDKRFTLLSIDDLIVYEESKSIPEIVSERGWEYFRDLEHKCCEKASRAFKEFALIDCGGGVCADLVDGVEVYSQRKIDAIKETALIVYLKRDVDYLASKIEGDSNRPSLSASNSFKEIMIRRGPWYERAADLIIDGGSLENELKKKKIGKEILAWFYAKSGLVPLESAGWYEIGGQGTVESLRKSNRWLSEEDEIRM